MKPKIQVERFTDEGKPILELKEKKLIIKGFKVD